MTAGEREAGMAADEPYDVVVIGAGFAGLYAVYKFREMGLRTIGFEKGSDVGGVWYWNRYPGARCDCESYYYSYSFSKELQAEWDWSLHYSEQPEILRYLNHVADRFALRDNIRFDTAVTSARFDAASGLWTVGTSKGAPVKTRFIVSAAGCLSEVLQPDIPGLKSFQGETFYTAAWPKTPPGFAGKRVGVIGTGASGVQAIPRIAREAAHITVFQRTANWVIPVWNTPMEAEFTRWVKENYEQIRERCNASGGGIPFEVSHTRAGDVSPEEQQEILKKAWTVGGTRFFAQSFVDLLANQEANDLAQKFVAAYIRSIVKDPQIAQDLIPTDHPIGTKRPPMDDDYYATFNRSNATLVNLRRTPIVRIEDHAIVTSDARHEIDALVLATGFDAITGPLLAMNITGRNGERLQDAWKDGPRTYLGLGVAGFPNLFTITGPLSPSVLANMPTAIEQHVDWIADCIGHMRAKGLSTIEPLAEAQEKWGIHTAQVAEGTLYPKANSWYFGSNIPGKPRAFGVYLGGFANYREQCSAIAAKGYEGFRFENAGT
jgi:cation diffusion facilitator CzcD-associated flavoprotein CzcO